MSVSCKNWWIKNREIRSVTLMQTLVDTPAKRFLFLEGWEWSRAIVISAAVAGLAAA